jgi:hypothetical protein
VDKYYVAVLVDTEREFPGFSIKPKENSGLMKAADWGLKIITLGAMKTFMTAFVTTVGDTVYVPVGWEGRPDASRASTLRHERVHIRQKRRYGAFLYLLRYFCWPLPAVWAVGRRDLEQEAYGESLRAYVDYYGMRMLNDVELRQNIIGHFMGANYFWTYPWRKSLNSWYDDLVKTIRHERTSN